MLQSNAPRARIKMSDSEIASRFERLGYRVSIDQIAFTTESVEDFYNARETLWSGIGTIKIHEDPGYWLSSALSHEQASPLGTLPL